MSVEMASVSSGILRPLLRLRSQGADRRQQELPKLDLRSFRLQCNSSVIGRGIRAVVYEIAIDPDSDRAADDLDHHRVPFPNGLLGAVGEIENAARFSFRSSPLRGRPSPALHVGNANVFENAPEIAGISVLHLDLDRAWEHPIKRAWRRGMYENASVSRRAGKAVLGLQPIIAVAGVGDEMSARFAETHQHSVAHDERIS